MDVDDDDFVPTLRIGGLEFANASGQPMSRKVMQMFVDCLEQVGAVIRDPKTGDLFPNLEVMASGKLDFEFEVDDDGEITSVKVLDDPGLKEQ